MQRIIFAFLTMPLIATGLLVLNGFIEGAGISTINAYLAATYILTVFPGSLIIYGMMRTKIVKPWHFGFAGFLTAALGVGIVLGKVPIVQVKLLVWLSFLGQFWEMLVAGLVAGLYFGLVGSVKPNKASNPTP